jgi:hypothetical protein
VLRLLVVAVAVKALRLRAAVVEVKGPRLPAAVGAKVRLRRVAAVEVKESRLQAAGAAEADHPRSTEGPVGKNSYRPAALSR